MITLYTFGPNFGLPDPSPFVIKAMVLLQMSGLEHRCEMADLRKAPKGKLPYMNDNGTVVPDSTLMRLHLEKHHGIDFDAALGDSERAVAWAFEKLCEDHLYWASVLFRWTKRDNFEKGPRHFFDRIPAPIRALIVPMVRRDVKRSLHGQGFGRLSDAELTTIVTRGVDSIAAFLADKNYLMGNQPCGADASVFAWLAGERISMFTSPVRDAVVRHPNLVSYVDRLMKQYFPALAPS